MKLKICFLVLSLALAACTKERLVLTPVFVPYDCGYIPAPDKFEALPTDASPSPSSWVNPLTMIEELIARIKQQNAIVHAYQDCVEKSKLP